MERKQVQSRINTMVRHMHRNSYEAYSTHIFVVLLFVKPFKLRGLSGNRMRALNVSDLMVAGLLDDLAARYYSIPFNHLVRKS